MKRIGLFHVPIHINQLELPHEEISEYVRQKFKNKKPYTSYYSADFNEELCSGMPARNRFIQQANHACIEFLKVRGVPESYMKNQNVKFWFSIYREGDKHCLHTHPRSLCSGTYYPYADNISVPIRFRNPANAIISMSEPTIPPDNFLWYFHQPTTGEMNIWPSWLEHEVGIQGPVERGKERIAISFNFCKS